MCARLVILCLSLIAAFSSPVTAAMRNVPAKIVLIPENGDLLSELNGVLQNEETAPQTRFEARRRAQNTARTLTDYLNSRGYFAAEASAGIAEAPALRPVVTLSPGPQFTISELSIDLGEMTESDLYARLVAKLDLAAGDPAVPAQIIAAEEQLRRNLLKEGYAFAQILERDAIGDREAGTLALTLRLAPGNKVTFGQLMNGNDAPLSAHYLQRLAPFKPGETYDPEKLATLNSRLTQTRIFRFASAQLAEAPSSPPPDPVHDVLLTLEPRERYTVTAGGSFSSSEGAGVIGGWSARNLTRRADTLDLTATVATQELSASADWRLPNYLGFGRGLRLTTTLAQEKTDAFDRDSLNISGLIDYRQSPTRSFVVGAGSEFTRERDAVERRDLQILSTSAAIRLDHADNLLNPTTGWRADARIEPGLVIGDETAQYVQVTAGGSAYQPFGEDNRLVLAGRLHTGTVLGSSTLELPTSRRFFAGGGGSARGFEFQSIGPKDADGQPTGGRSIIEAAGELRWRYSERLGFVGFVDGASVNTDSAPQTDNLRYGAGLGLRYFTAIGPLRVDIATPLERETGEDPVQFYISLGQAF